jgi:hypothetical protein
MWIEQEAEFQERIHKWEEQELEHKCEEPTCELPPPVPADAPFPPSPTYETTFRYRITPAPYVITRSCPPPWPNKKTKSEPAVAQQLYRQSSRTNCETMTTSLAQQKPKSEPILVQRQQIHPSSDNHQMETPPWPNKHPNTHPISSITNSHPTPWPNWHHWHHHHCRNTKCPISQTPCTHPPPWLILSPDPLQNHWNVRRQLRRRSQTLSIT